MALDDWYSKNNEYDFVQYKALTDEGKKFSAIVWKASSGKNVGFGIKGKYVVGWYCDEPNTNGDYKDNVSEDCNKDNYNSCYNVKATKAHNLKRLDHGTDELNFDSTIAKEA
jgi:hypothetical protein